MSNSRFFHRAPIDSSKAGGLRRVALLVAAVSLFLAAGWIAALILLSAGTGSRNSIDRPADESGSVESGASAGRREVDFSAVKSSICESDGAEMIFIPPGEFTMGTNGGYANEKPERRVYVAGVYLYKYEVTNAQYKKFLESDAGKGHEPDAPYGDYMPVDYFTNPRYANYPVVNVSWEDAAAYCRWAGNRLPKESEWEKGARGVDARAYPWGDVWNEKFSNWDDISEGGADGFRFTAPAGSFPQGASPFGLQDMAGNVWEWVDDWYQPYEGNSTMDIDYGSTYRVIRGGSWLRYPLGLTATSRDASAPTLRYDSIGFRCACDQR